MLSILFIMLNTIVLFTTEFIHLAVLGSVRAGKEVQITEGWGFLFRPLIARF
jgi:hypothetical protein